MTWLCVCVEGGRCLASLPGNGTRPPDELPASGPPFERSQGEVFNEPHWKVFTVLIFVMSLVFMALALSVYAVHKNWREAVLGEMDAGGRPVPGKEGLAKLLKSTIDDRDKAVKQKEQLEQERTTEEKAQRDQITKAENELKNLQQPTRRRKSG